MTPETRQAIFNYFSEQHDLLLLEGDLDELQNIIQKYEELTTNKVEIEPKEDKL